MEKFCERLISLRKLNNLSQSTVAQAVNIVLRTYQRYESNERIPDIEVASALADFFGVSLDFLCGRTDDKK